MDRIETRASFTINALVARMTLRSTDNAPQKRSGSPRLERAAWFNDQPCSFGYQSGPAGRRRFRGFGQPFVHEDLDLHATILLPSLTGCIIRNWLFLAVSERRDDPPQRNHVVLREILNHGIRATMT